MMFRGMMFLLNKISLDISRFIKGSNGSRCVVVE
jgi:hypothetical protein